MKFDKWNPWIWVNRHSLLLNAKTGIIINKQKGQSLIEYLILVALMAVSTIAVVRSLSYVVQTRFANALYAIQGSNKTVRTESFDERTVKKRDLSDFINGAAQGSQH
ncbi:MAG: hypothetical protein K1X29_08005 [Bdellovibrionales bacterium]|nr:hypothetical protein [Bdellovibrionales bacterium]